VKLRRLFIGAAWASGVLIAGLVLFVAWRLTYGVPEITRAALNRDNAEVRRLLAGGDDPNTTVAFYLIEEAWTLHDPGFKSPLSNRLAGVFGLGPPAPSLLEIACGPWWGKTNWELIELLVEQEALDAKSRFASDAMETAIRDRRFDVADKLLSKGYPLNPTGKSGPSSPLQMCAAGNLEGCKFFLARGAKISMLYAPGSTKHLDGTIETYNVAKFSAPMRDALDICRVLTKEGVPLHLYFWSGSSTWMHHAVATEDVALAEFLLDNNYDVDFRPNRVRSALDFAKEKQNTVLIRLLEAATAKRAKVGAHEISQP
jgi:hypothetical protein